jgi:hypothetical protein
MIGCIKAMFMKLATSDADALVLGFSEGRSSRVSGLTKAEGMALIGHLKKTDPDEAACDRMRKKIIALAYEYHGLGKNASKGERTEVVKHVEAWVLKYGHGCANGRHKHFNSYTAKELPLLVSQFESGVYKDFIKKV